MRWKLYAVGGACLTAALFTLPGLAAAGPAAAATTPAPGSRTLPSGTVGCEKSADLLAMQCQSFVVSTAKARAAAKAAALAEATARANGQTPAVTAAEPLTAADLQAAYGLGTESSTGGAGETVAIVDAFYDPNADADLAKYRSANGLSPCAQASGCLSVYNEHGANLYGNPSADPPLSPSGDNWVPETSLDLDMVSAICPNCKIDLIEASSDLLPDLTTAEDAAVSLGAKFVSNSWSGSDFPGESAYDKYFNHPGVAITVASGDSGYRAGYPASSQYVTSVGGTFLNQNSSGSWTSAVWNDTGTENADTVPGATAAGCSSGEPQPSWELDASGSTVSSDCANRTENDVSAVADSPSGIDIYDSADCSGNCDAYGTSAATPIIAAMYALAGNPAPNTYPASYLYQNPQDLTHITSAPSGFSATDVQGGGPTCESNRQFLCNTARSLTSPDTYNGPTGLGTPNGNLTPFKETEKNFISVPNPGSFDFQAGAKVTLPSLGSHTELSGTKLTYSAKGLPSGLALSGDIISGTLSGTPTPAAGDTVTVTVTGANSTATPPAATVSFRITTTKSLDTGFHQVFGPVKLDAIAGGSLDGKCLDDSRDGKVNGDKVDSYACNGGASQNWEYYPGAAPSAPGSMRINGKCAWVINNSKSAGTKVELWTCDAAAGEQWLMAGSAGELYNPNSGQCLADPNRSTTNGIQLQIEPCDGGGEQAWLLPGSPIQSGVTGMCVNDASSAAGAPISVSSCSGSGTQKFVLGLDGLSGDNTIEIHNECLEVKNNGSTNGSPVVLEPCNGSNGEYWQITADGSIENLWSQQCLADPSNKTASGTQLVIANCYGQAGEVWATS